MAAPGTSGVNLSASVCTVDVDIIIYQCKKRMKNAESLVPVFLMRTPNLVYITVRKMFLTKYSGQRERVNPVSSE